MNEQLAAIIAHIEDLEVIQIKNILSKICFVCTVQLYNVHKFDVI